jgi:hypothetical protein
MRGAAVLIVRADGIHDGAEESAWRGGQTLSGDERRTGSEEGWVDHGAQFTRGITPHRVRAFKFRVVASLVTNLPGAGGSGGEPREQVRQVWAEFMRRVSIDRQVCLHGL